MFKYGPEITEQQLLEHSLLLEGKLINQIGNQDEVNIWLGNTKNKGALGNAIQACYFGVPANSIKGADFNFHNIELKVTPVKKVKPSKRNNMITLAAKERLVLTIINYMEDWKYPFETSPLIKKSNEMLLIFYLHELDTEIRDMKILKSQKFTIPLEDWPTIREDYEIITNKIKAGLAHELSESDTIYLSACTKGAGKGKDFRQQPFSEIKAKQRAFSFKNSYMTNYFNSIYDPSYIESLSIHQSESLTQYIDNKFMPFENMNIEQVAKQLNYLPSTTIDTDKGFLPRLSAKILDVKDTNLNNLEQFQKANIKFKTIRLRKDKANNQDMSFPNIDFEEILNVPFEDSSWNELFAETKYLFVLFEETAEGTFFRKSLLWNMSHKDLVNLEKLYNHLKQMLLDKTIEINIIEKNGREYWQDNTPKKAFIPNIHIRTKGTKQHSTTILPDGRLIKKKCLFLNKEYIQSLFY